MDIYSFINSHDIAAHCREIGKVWTPFEMAVMIDGSRRPIAEKNTAWRELISDYPDVSSPEIYEVDSFDSLHKKLEGIINDYECLLEKFKEPEAGAIYRYNDWSGYYRDPDHVLDNFETAVSEAMEYCDSWGDEAQVFRMTKSFINDKAVMTALFNHEGNLVNIYSSHKQSGLFPHICNGGRAFDADVSIPLPFKRGDILTYNKNWDREDADIIFVLDSFDRDDPKWLEKVSRGELKSDDAAVHGFSVCEHSGYLECYESSYNINHLEYYREKLKENHRLLHYVSLYLKDELRLPELLAMQSRIILENQLENNIFQEEKHSFASFENENKENNAAQSRTLIDKYAGIDEDGENSD